MTDLLRSNAAAAGVFLALGFLLLALLHLQERLVSRFVAHRLGWRALLVTGWLGVPVHELAHWLVARAFGHRIIAWRLYDPDPVTGTLGYVHHAYRQRTAFQLVGNFFIGIAPPVFGMLLIASIGVWAVSPEVFFGKLLAARRFEAPLLAALHHGPADILLIVLGDVLRSSADLITAVWSQRTWALPLQLYLGAAIAVHMAPSWADIRGAWAGALVFFIALGISVFILSWLGVSVMAFTIVIALGVPCVGWVLIFQAVYLAAVWGIAALAAGAR